MRKILNKCTATLLSIALLLSCIVTGVATSTETSATVWDGETLTAPTTGSGTETDPFEVSTAAQLAYAINAFGKDADGEPAHYKLTADIYLNDVSSDTWTSNTNINTWFEGADKNGYNNLDEEPISGAFVGSIDGDGHMVYGIYYPEDTASFASGLIPVFSGSYIRNLGVDKAYIVSDLSSNNSEKGAGVIAGITRNSRMTIDSCFSGANVTVKSNGSSASGIVGTVRNGADTKLYISNCYSLIPNSNIIMKNNGTDRAADSTYGSYANGIVGNTWDCYFSVTNSYSIAKPYLLNSKNRLSLDCLNADKTAASEAIITNFANVYSESDVTKAWNNQFPTFGTYTNEETGTEHYVATQLTAEEMTGANALENMELGDKFFATDSYPALKVLYPQLEPGTVWDGSSLIPPTAGSGTDADPFKVSTAAELAYAINAFGKDADGSAAHYKLTADIYLNDVSSDTWTSNTNINTWFEGKDKSTYYALNEETTYGAFVGSIDGDGYTVYGIYYPETTTSFASGLIPVFSGSYIKNIGVDKACIVSDLSNSNRGSGAIAGITINSLMTIDSCFSGENITVKAGINSGASGIVGAVRNGTEAAKLTVSNCYSLIPSDRLFVGTYASDDSEGNGAYANGILGNTWGPVYFSVTNSYSVAKPYVLNNKSKMSADCIAYDSENTATGASEAIITNFANVYSASKVTTAWGGNFDTFGTYTDDTGTYVVATQLTEMTGANALQNMSGFNTGIWYAVNSSSAYPMLRVHGTAIGDVDEDGRAPTENDVTELRKTLIGVSSYRNTDYLRDGEPNICDLVLISIKNSEIGTTLSKMLGNVECEVVPYPLSEVTEIVYTADDESAKMAAENLASFLNDNGIKGITAVSEADAGSLSKTILIKSEQSNDCSVSVEDGTLTFAGESAQLIKLVEFYASLGYYGNYAWTFTCSVEDLGYGFNTGVVTLSSNNSYSYVWGDEFNLTALDGSRWNWSVANTNIHGYSDNSISDKSEYINHYSTAGEDGYLRLTTKADGDGTFTSPASFSTFNKMSYKYGYAEIRARLPYTKGAWPSFWTKNDWNSERRDTTHYSVEVDVFEVYGDDPLLDATMHKWYKLDGDKCSGCEGTENGFLGIWGKCDDYPCHESKLIGQKDTSALDKTQWHTYGFEWTPTEISMYIDGERFVTYDLSTDLSSSEGDDNMDGFKDPLYVIFNNHAISPESGRTRGIITEEDTDLLYNFIANYDIDYFRLYQNSSVEGTALYTN